MYYTRLSAPASKPVTAKEVADFLRMELEEIDDLITSFIDNAVEQVESITGQRLISQQWRLDLERFPVGEISLRYPPLVAVDTIQYYDSNNTLQTLPTAEYEAATPGGYGVVRNAAGYPSWPATYNRMNAVQVTYTCGYTDADAVPQGLKNAIKTIVWHLDDSRGESIDRKFLKSLLGPHMRRGFA